MMTFCFCMSIQDKITEFFYMADVFFDFFASHVRIFRTFISTKANRSFGFN